ncbi:hypothetical protein GGP77_002305 [Salinibacter ruber]|uniref:TIGR03032 family protein n=1 Tax=Salinibacter ruber TaxID=146919 RepID=UPI002169D72C|nr:TIGR03032 family protein [Salinibacter ruber]MCS3668062.1 hypothetical protein [Salinibacter ruber]
MKNKNEKIVVSTHSFLVVICLSEKLEVTDHLVVNKGHHYGVALGDEYFVSKNKDKFFEKRKYEKPYESVNRVEPPVQGKEIHQICFANSGYYVADTYNNRVIYFKENNEVLHVHNLYSFDDDYNHVNSVFPCGNIIFALLHNHGREPSEIVALRHTPSRGFSRVRGLRLWHEGCHNIFLDDEHLYYNASGNGYFVVANTSTGEVVKKVELNGHTKGMAVFGDTILVGVSEFAQQEDRPEARGLIAILDRSSLNLKSMVDVNFDTLPRPIGNINEIRCLTGGDEAHSRRCHTRLHEMASLNSSSPLECIKNYKSRILHHLRMDWRRLVPSQLRA